MHVILSALGSYGDVLPMVGIGAAARARGHRVQVVANPYFQDVVAGAGLELLPLGTADEYRELMQHPDLWHPRRGLKLVLGRGAGAYLRQAFATIDANYRPGETVLAAHGLDLGSRLLHELRGAPLATVHFAPFALVSLHDTPRYIGVPDMKRWPRWLKYALYRLGDVAMVDPVIGPPLNALRRELGLPAVRRIYSVWNNSPQLVLGLWPDWFAPLQPDWPECTALTGFPLWDPPAEHAAGADVNAFLAAGEPPIAFAPGSANVQAQEFFRVAVETCQRMGRRGMLLTKYPAQAPDRLPPTVRQFGFIPFSMLLPRVAALVHHGGIGTCAQGLAAGIPQVVVPMAYDQLDNGLRLQRLGVGAVVSRRRLAPRRLARELNRLLTSPSVPRACAELAQRCDGPASLEAACDLLEQLHANRRRPAESCLPQPSHASKY
ncbi:MAG: glycosyl transferase [Planctomycetota bacterium]|nr:MAG: glycosyl transferase [Planctomycetota bacterium]